jgi:hypothetical protein
MKHLPLWAQRGPLLVQRFPLLNNHTSLVVERFLLLNEHLPLLDEHLRLLGCEGGLGCGWASRARGGVRRHRDGPGGGGRVDAQFGGEVEADAVVRSWTGTCAWRVCRARPPLSLQQDPDPGM